MHWVLRALFLGVKRPWRETDHSHPMQRLRTSGAVISLLHIPSWMHKENFILVLIRSTRHIIQSSIALECRAMTEFSLIFIVKKIIVSVMFVLRHSYWRVTKSPAYVFFLHSDCTLQLRANALRFPVRCA
jgi:hypothetical protein